MCTPVTMSTKNNPSKNTYILHAQCPGLPCSTKFLFQSKIFFWLVPKSPVYLSEATHLQNTKLSCKSPPLTPHTYPAPWSTGNPQLTAGLWQGNSTCSTKTHAECSSLACPPPTQRSGHTPLSWHAVNAHMHVSVSACAHTNGAVPTLGNVC